MAEETYNPLDKQRLAESVAQALLARPAVPLGDIAAFDGAGIYAIYYTGDFPLYEKLVRKGRAANIEQPIYVGKAIPKGGRKGGWGLGIDPGSVLSARLRHHARSISNANNLKLGHFTCRYLVVDDVWIPLAESLVIEGFSPLWNVVLEGFGNNDPGRNRYQGARPTWDTVHPGRSWADRVQPNQKSIEEIEQLVVRALAGDPTARTRSVEDAVMEADDDGESE